MNAEERAFLVTTRNEVMRLLGTFGNIERFETPGSDQARRARRGALNALALADELSKRMNRADVATEQATIEAGGYDLAALKAAPPATIED